MSIRSKPGVVIDRPKVYRRVEGDVDGAREFLATETEAEFKTIDKLKRDLDRRAKRRGASNA